MQGLKGSVLACVSSIIVISTYTAGVFGQDRDKTAQQLHSVVVDSVEEYKNNRNSKALAACINWQASTLYELDIFYFHWSSTSEGSGGQIFVTQLMQSALNDCESNRKRTKIDCRCVPIDKNGRSVLKIPDFLFQSTPENLGAAQEPKALANSGGRTMCAESTRAAAPTSAQSGVSSTSGGHGTLPEAQQSAAANGSAG